LASKGCVASESFDFHDITLDEYDQFKKLYHRAEQRFRLFSEEHAHRVLNFINRFKNQDPAIILVVHCAQGISRSGAIGLFACRYLGLDEDRFLVAHPNIRPNSLVYDTLCKASGLQRALESLWERKIPESLDILLARENHGIQSARNNSLHDMHESK
jgi:predicted protein tyrosine phosphatase